MSEFESDKVGAEPSEAKGGNARPLGTLWGVRKIESMVSGEIDVQKLENLLKAAKVGKKSCVKILGFMNHTRKGNMCINLLAEPADPYKGGKDKKARLESW